MNGSNPFPFLSPAGGGLPSTPAPAVGRIGQGADGVDGSFEASLTAALSPPVASPIVPVVNQPANEIGLNASLLAGGDALGQEGTPLGELVPGSVSPSQLTGPKLDGAGHGAGPLTAALNQPLGMTHPGAQLSSEAALGEVGTKAGGNQAEQGLHPHGSKAALLASLSRLGEQNPTAMTQDGRQVPSEVISLAKGSLPINGAQQPIVMTAGDDQVSTMAAIAAATSSTVEAMASGNFTQPRQPRSHDAGQLSTADAQSGGLTKGSTLEPLKSEANVGLKPSLHQSAGASDPRPSFAEPSRDQLATDDTDLTQIKAGGQAANTPGAAALVASAVKPDALVGAANVNQVEAIDNGARSSSSAEVFGFDTQTLDPAGTTASKPSASASQPPSAQVAMQIARAIPQGIDRFSIQLHPAELGMVEIRLDFAEEGRVSALITAERPETLEMLQRDSRSIERTLNNAGLSLENNGLSFSLQQEQHQQGQGFSAASHQQSQSYQRSLGRSEGVEIEAEQQLIAVDKQRLLDIRT